MSAPEYELTVAPLLEVGMSDNDRPTFGFAGSSFALWSSTHYVTAAHCTEHDRSGGQPLEAHELAVYRPTSGIVPVATVERHPEADLAVLRLAAPDDERVRPFQRVDPWPSESIGETVQHFGWAPGNGDEIHGAASVARVTGFHGTGREDRFRYVCANLTGAPPHGHSGGPVWRPEDPLTAVGMYVRGSTRAEPTGQCDPFMLWRITETRTWALRLADYADWLAERIPQTAENAA